MGGTVSLSLARRVFANGNNVPVFGDTTRRTIVCRQETDLERPETRETFRHPDLLGWIAEHRRHLVALALTMLRGYCAAGSPKRVKPSAPSRHGLSSSRALATAFVLSGGAAEGPIDGLAVDRLGPPGSPLMAKVPHGLLVAGSLEGLKEARIRSDIAHDSGSWQRILFQVAPGSLDGSKSLTIRRLNAILRESPVPISGVTGLVKSSLIASVAVPAKKPIKPATVDPDWLDWLPKDQAMAAFAVAIDPVPANLETAFRVADRVEKVDPARENLAPLRLRLDLLARTFGIRTEDELLPHLKGMTGWLGGNGAISGSRLREASLRWRAGR